MVYLALSPTSPRTPGLSRLSLLLVLAAGCVIAGCASDAVPEDDPGLAVDYRPVAGTKLLMSSMLDPAADFIWDAVHDIYDEDGLHEYRPETDEEWVLVRNNAVVLAEAGNLLLMKPRSQPGNWDLWARDLTDAAEAAMFAADARDSQRVFDVGEEIYNTCAGCHAEYWTADFEPPETAPRFEDEESKAKSKPRTSAGDS